MINFSSLPYSERQILCKKVFTQAAAARILGERWNQDLSKVERKIKIRSEWEYVIWVHVPGHRPIFISKLEFIEHFLNFRINSASEQLLDVKVDYKYPRFAWVNNYKLNKVSSYQLQLLRGGVRCDCHDFINQEDGLFIAAMQNYIPSFKPACKHIFKFLFSINIFSQSGWIENQRWADRWSPQPDPWEEVA